MSDNNNLENKDNKNLKNKENNKSKNLKFIVPLSSIIALLVVAVGLGYAHRTKVENVDKQLDQLETQVSSLYLAGEEFLVSGLTLEDFTSIENELDIEVITEEQQGRLDGITDKFNVARQMYDTEQLVDTIIDENGVLKVGVTMETILAAEQAVVELETVKTQLAAELHVSTEEAKKQLAEIDEATTLVHAMFSDIENKVVEEDVTRSEYDAALSAVNKIRQSEAKSNLTVLTDCVDAHLTEIEKAEAEKKAKEEAERKAKEEAERKAEEAEKASVKKVLLDVPLISQLPELPTGCEITSMTMMYNYAGANVNKVDMAKEMPKHKSDPNKGYVGDPFTKGGWTIYPPALMAMTEKYCGSAKNMTGSSEKQLEAQLNSGKPVVVWVTMHGFAVHAVTLTGYDGYNFYYNDPWSGEKNASIERDSFMYSWSAQSYRAISY